MGKFVKIKAVIAMAKPFHPTKNADFEDLRNSLDQICSQVAQRFSVYAPDGKPRKATILAVVGKSSCIGCIAKKLSARPIAKHVDAMYLECHRLAVNVLVEELYDLFMKVGYNVRISTETKLEYGKADVTITITNYGVNLRCNGNELLIEVKIGRSLSLSQLLRYLIDKRSNTIIVWRVRRRQILVFDTEDIKPLLMEFMRMICLRGTRLLSSPQPTCQHTQRREFQPTQEALQEMFQDFAEALIETLPNILEAITERLGIGNSPMKSDE